MLRSLLVSGLVAMAVVSSAFAGSLTQEAAEEVDVEEIIISADEDYDFVNQTTLLVGGAGFTLFLLFGLSSANSSASSN